MHPPVDKTVFLAQHKNKCYCQNHNRNLCYCIGIESGSTSLSGSSHQFIKVRNDKTKPNKSTSICSKSSFSAIPTLMSSSSMTTTTETKITGRRELYERSKLEGIDYNNKFNVLAWNMQDHIPLSGADHTGLFSDERITKLQEFRIQNAKECLSSCKRLQVDKIKLSGASSKELICEQTPKYSLNTRGLLKTIGGNDDGRAAIVSSKSAINIILRQNFNSSKNKDVLISKALYHAENSLALRYQKT